MYTQCPECHIAFRVTAKVLQQADGRVRCGNCNHAFNAIHYLSEDMPAAPHPDDEPTEGVSSGDDLAETSRRLLATLDELAGPDDVRIEDTGIEWRVLDDAATDEDQDAQLSPEELRYDDNSPLPEDLDDAGDGAWSTPAPRRRDEDFAASPVTFGDGDIELALSDPDDWTDILEEVTDSTADSLEVEEQLLAIHSELSAIEDELTDEVPALDEIQPVEDVPALDDVPLEAGAADVDFVLADDEDDGVIEAVMDDAVEGDDEDTGVFEAAGDAVESDDATAGDLQAVGIAVDDEPVEETSGAAHEESGAATPADEITENWIDTLTFEHMAQPGEPATDDDGDSEPDLSGIEVTEEPQDDAADAGQAVTEPEPAVESEPDRPAPTVQDYTATFAALENPEALFDESSGEVETIIMEGDFVRSQIERDRLAAESAARSQLDDPARLVDTYAMRRGRMSGGRRSNDPLSPRMLALAGGLSLLLVAQVVHNSRESLATFGFFNQTIAPLYSLVGNPVIPDWDVRGWRFEATSGSIDEGETTLTIVSRIGNRSDEPLPYPLVHLALTNRYEDVMGSRVLEPGEYLAGDLDPSAMVAPGESFTAVLKVEQPPADATGFKVNVCYRVRAGSVRCAIESFKN